MEGNLSGQDALVVVNVQNAFCPGGSLGTRSGDEVVPVLNVWIDAVRLAGGLVVAARDWHPADHRSFRGQGGLWPAHAVQGTEDAEFHAGLRLPSDAVTVDIGAAADDDDYSAFADGTLAGELRRRGITRVWIGGLCTEFCVRTTVLDALTEGFHTHLIVDGIRPLRAEDGLDAVEEMRQAGAIVERTPAHSET